jgi:hypothetical protein
MYPTQSLRSIESESESESESQPMPTAKMDMIGIGSTANYGSVQTLSQELIGTKFTKNFNAVTPATRKIIAETYFDIYATRRGDNNVKMERFTYNEFRVDKVEDVAKTVTGSELVNYLMSNQHTRNEEYMAMYQLFVNDEPDALDEMGLSAMTRANNDRIIQIETIGKMQDAWIMDTLIEMEWKGMKPSHTYSFLKDRVVINVAGDELVHVETVKYSTEQKTLLISVDVLRFYVQRDVDFIERVRLSLIDMCASKIKDLQRLHVIVSQHMVRHDVTHIKNHIHGGRGSNHVMFRKRIVEYADKYDRYMSELGCIEHIPLKSILQMNETSSYENPTEDTMTELTNRLKHAKSLTNAKEGVQKDILKQIRDRLLRAIDDSSHGINTITGESRSDIRNILANQLYALGSDYNTFNAHATSIIFTGSRGAGKHHVALVLSFVYRSIGYSLQGCLSKTCFGDIMGPIQTRDTSRINVYHDVSKLVDTYKYDALDGVLYIAPECPDRTRDTSSRLVDIDILSSIGRFTRDYPSLYTVVLACDNTDINKCIFGLDTETRATFSLHVRMEPHEINDLRLIFVHTVNMHFLQTGSNNEIDDILSEFIFVIMHKIDIGVEDAFIDQEHAVRVQLMGIFLQENLKLIVDHETLLIRPSDWNRDKMHIIQRTFIEYLKKYRNIDVTIHLDS